LTQLEKSGAPQAAAQERSGHRAVPAAAV